MSGNSYESECPECGSAMQSYNDWKPYDTVSHECLECGFAAYTDERQLTLEEVNNLRADIELPALEKLKDKEV